MPHINTGVAFKSISQYPFISRDVSFWVPKDVSEESVLDVIISKGRTFLVRSEKFDQFEKDVSDQLLTHWQDLGLDETALKTHHCLY